MSVDFRKATIIFDPTSGQVQNEDDTVVFKTKVNEKKVEAALMSFDIKYSGGDHHLKQTTIVPKILLVKDNTVKVGVKYLLRDNSGNIDDTYEGRIEVLVIAEVASTNGTVISAD